MSIARGKPGLWTWGGGWGNVWVQLKWRGRETSSVPEALVQGIGRQGSIPPRALPIANGTPKKKKLMRDIEPP